MGNALRTVNHSKEKRDFKIVEKLNFVVGLDLVSTLCSLDLNREARSWARPSAESNRGCRK